MTDQPDKVQLSGGWSPPSDEDIARAATVTAADIRDAIDHLRETMPQLAREWGLMDDQRVTRNPGKLTKRTQATRGRNR